MRGIGYFCVWIVPIMAIWAIGQGMAHFLAVLALTFIVHPLVDRLIPSFDRAFSIPEAVANIPLYLSLPIQMALLFYAFKYGNASVAAMIQAGVLCGVSGGIMGMCAAHELIHRDRKVENGLGKFLLLILQIPQFVIEHFWHHAKIGTPHDVATARRGETLYRFIWRSSVSGWILGWRWKPKQMALLTAAQVAVLSGVRWMFGPSALLILVIQGGVTLFMLKWVDYLEHYGLTRERVGHRYEAVKAHHSWDSTRPFTNWYLFNLGFHSHHHQKPKVSYAALPASGAEGHELPHGYSTMMLIALFPQLWCRVLHPILDSQKTAREQLQLVC